MFLSLRLPHEVTQMSWIVLVVLKEERRKYEFVWMPLKIQFHSSSFLCPCWTFGETDSVSVFKASSDAPHQHWFRWIFMGTFSLLHNISLSPRLIPLIILSRCHPIPGEAHRGLKFDLKQKKVSKMSSSNHSYNSPVPGRVKFIPMNRGDR